MQTSDPKISQIVLALTQNQSVLHSYIFLRMGNDEVARDVLQETNLSIWKNIERLDSPENFLPWAKTIASLEIRHYLTDRKREEAKVVFDSDTVDQLAETLQAPEEEEARYDEMDYKALNDCLDSLPKDKRRLVSRRYWDRKTVESIAREEKIPFSTIAMRLLRIRKELGDCVRHLLCRFQDGPKATPDELARAELIERALNGNPGGAGDMCGRLKADAGFRHEWFVSAGMHIALLQNAEVMHRTDVERRNAFLRKELRLSAQIAAGLLLAAGIGWGVSLFGRPGKPVPATPVAAQASREEAAAPTQWQQSAEAQVSPPRPARAPSQAPNQPQVFSEAPMAAATTPPREAAAWKGERMNASIITRAAATLTVAAGAAILPASQTLADGSAEARLASLCVNKARYWQTAFTNEIPVRWKWFPKAATATLTATGMNTTYTASFATNDSSGSVSCFLPASAAEDYYTLVLTFREAGGTEVGAITSHVACIKGVSQDGNVPGVTLDTTAAAETAPVKVWPRVRRPGAKGENVVVGYKAAWATNATPASATFSVARRDGGKSFSCPVEPAEGWCAWKVENGHWGFGWFDFAVDFGPAAKLSGAVYRPSVGTVIKLL